jgi:hypothetical protein
VFGAKRHLIIFKQSKGCDDSGLLAVFRGDGYLLKMVQPSMLAERSIMLGRGYLSGTMMVLRRR